MTVPQLFHLVEALAKTGYSQKTNFIYPPAGGFPSRIFLYPSRERRIFYGENLYANRGQRQNITFWRKKSPKVRFKSGNFGDN